MRMVSRRVTVIQGPTYHLREVDGNESHFLSSSGWSLLGTWHRPRFGEREGNVETAKDGKSARSETSRVVGNMFNDLEVFNPTCFE